MSSYTLTLSVQFKFTHLYFDGKNEAFSHFFQMNSSWEFILEKTKKNSCKAEIPAFECWNFTSCNYTGSQPLACYVGTILSCHKREERKKSWLHYFQMRLQNPVSFSFSPPLRHLDFHGVTMGVTMLNTNKSRHPKLFPSLTSSTPFFFVVKLAYVWSGRALALPHSPCVICNPRFSPLQKTSSMRVSSFSPRPPEQPLTPARDALLPDESHWNRLECTEPNSQNNQ